MKRQHRVVLREFGMAIESPLDRADCELLRGIFGPVRYHWFPGTASSFLAFGGAKVMTEIGGPVDRCPFGFVPDKVTAYRPDRVDDYVDGKLIHSVPRPKVAA